MLKCENLLSISAKIITGLTLAVHAAEIACLEVRLSFITCSCVMLANVTGCEETKDRSICKFMLFRM